MEDASGFLIGKPSLELLSFLVLLPLRPNPVDLHLARIHTLERAKALFFLFFFFSTKTYSSYMLNTPRKPTSRSMSQSSLGSFRFVVETLVVSSSSER